MTMGAYDADATAAPAFADLYRERYAVVYDLILADGTAIAEIERLDDILEAQFQLDDEGEAQRLIAYLEARTAALAELEYLQG